MARPSLGLLCCLASFCGAAMATAGGTCHIVQLSSETGTVRRQPGGAECAWHINPDLDLQRIEFVTSESFFNMSDRLSFYITASPSATRTRKIASFSRWAPLPRKMQLTGTNEVLLLTTIAEWSDTAFEIHYTCFPAGHRLGGMYFSTLAYIAVLSAASIAVALVLAAPLYLLCFCRAKLRQDAAMQASEVVRRAELAQRRRENTENRIRAAIAEARTAGALDALPTEQWNGPPKGAEDEAEAECCLCLEPYSHEDTLRVLPCSHYFHKDCVDRWFAARRFMPRACPLCKRDPVPTPDLESGGGCSLEDGQAAGGVPAPSQAWAEPDSTPSPAAYGRGAAARSEPDRHDDLDMQAVDTE